MLARSLVLALVILPSAAGLSDAVAQADKPAPRAPSVSLAAQLDTALQDEYHAEQVYQRVLADHGDIRPFANVVLAEQRHASYIVGLLQGRNAAVPANRWHAGNVPRFATVREACEGAAAAEVANIGMYDRFLAGTLPDDVRQVFEQNRWASAERHLPAFNRCR